METQTQLNDNLLKDEVISDEPKRNSKLDIISKIIKCCEEGDVELPYSDTKLQRMTKQQLCKLLAECIDKKVRNHMAAQVGAKSGASDSVIALGALKMIHSIAANSAENAINLVLPGYGYEVVGFTESLKESAVDQAVNMCLEEIAADSDILQYVESPYTRLAIAWSGALISSIKKRRPIKKRNYATRMEPRSNRSENSVQLGSSGGPTDGKVERRVRFTTEDVKSV